MFRSPSPRGFLLYLSAMLTAGPCASAASAQVVPAPPAANAPTAVPAPPQKPSKISPDLINPATSFVSAIIQYANGPSTSELQLLQSLGASSPVALQSINAVQVTISSSALGTLSGDSNIKYVSLDRVLSPHGVPGGPNADPSIATSPEYTAEPINAPAVWSQGYVGTGIGVAVIDSGITTERDLSSLPAALAPLLGPGVPAPAAPVKGPGAAVAPTPVLVGPGGSRVVYSQDFVPDEPNDTNDHYGHGTHVAGLIAGNGTASTGKQFFRTFLGIAPNVNLINLRVLDSNGQGTDTAVIQAIQTAIALKNTYNIRVINLSLGRGVYESYTLDPLCQAVEQAWKAGIVVVVAAGNDGRNLALNSEAYGTIDAPGNDPYVLTVGATNTMNTATLTDDVMASYSSKGPSFIDQVAKPDVVAPGNLVTSLLAAGSNLQQENPTFFTPNGFYQLNGNPDQSSPDYMPLSGTSMATGVTSGAVALLLNANSSLTPDQVKALIMLSANKTVLPATSSVAVNGITYLDSNDVFTIGAGYLDIAATVSQASNNLVPSGTAMSPIASYDPNSNTVSLVTDSTALWGRTSLFGAAGVYGSNAFLSGSTALWGRSVLNASSTTSGSTALWGRTALSGASDPSGYTALWGRTALWGSDIPDASTALWGRSDPAGSTALWGRSALQGSTALWGRDIFVDQ